MFDKEYSFRGRHADRARMLTEQFEIDKKLNKKVSIFDRNIDVYINAPIIGFLYQRKAELDKEGNNTFKIFPDTLMKEREKLIFNYRLIMLLDKENEPNFEERVNKAFRYFNTEKGKEDEELYEQYVRGGVDVLYEKIIENSNKNEDYLKNLYQFIEEVDLLYNQKISGENIIDLCKLARD